MSLCLNPLCSQPQNPDHQLFCQACGSELLIAGRYQVHKLLSGKGGFSDTYEVFQQKTAKVLKVLHNNHPKVVELFQKEANILTHLQHEGIPKGEGYFEYFPRNAQEPLHCLVMEKIAGIDLDEYEKQRNFLPIDQTRALEWIEQLINILAVIHSQQFFHRDIKPSNIILKPDGKLVLIDFGAIRQVTATIIAGRQTTGIYTPGYAPPEQEKGYAVPQSDFFALGRTFVFLLTGKQPTDPELYDHYNNEFKWRESVQAIEQQFADFIDYLMAEKIYQRPQNTQEALQALAQVKNNWQQPIKIKQSPKNKQKNQFSSANFITKNPDKNQIIGQYPTFSHRLVAAIFDNTLVIIASAIIGAVLSWQIPNTTVDFFIAMIGATTVGSVILILGVISWLLGIINLETSDKLFLFYLMIGFLVKWLYYVCLTSSNQQGTLGKNILGLEVLDLQGKPLSFARANMRYWSKIISSLILYFGFFMSLWQPKKQTLHDKISRTIVVFKDKK